MTKRLAASLAAAALCSGLAGCSVLIQRALQEVPTIEVGECTDFAGYSASDEDVYEVVLVSCSEPHKWEAYAEETVDDRAFPGDDVLYDLADEFCYQAFGSFVGVSYEESVYEFTSLTPSREGWELNGDRMVTCLIGDEAGGISGSLAGVEA